MEFRTENACQVEFYERQCMWLKREKKRGKTKIKSSYCSSVTKWINCVFNFLFFIPDFEHISHINEIRIEPLQRSKLKYSTDIDGQTHSLWQQNGTIFREKMPTAQYAGFDWIFFLRGNHSRIRNKFNGTCGG